MGDNAMTEHQRIVEALKHLRPKAQFRLQGTKLMWADPTQTEPTQEEIDAKVEELRKLEPMRVLREERNKKLAETDWWASSDLLISDDQRKYRQALRDITKTADPQLNEFDELINVIWPEKP